MNEIDEMKSFTINANLDYVIYGAGGDCYHLISTLQTANYNINGIIDKRAASLKEIQGIPVFNLEEYKCENIANTVFVVTIKNVFEHVNIVRALLEKGYYNVIYKPFPILQGNHDKEWDSINWAYDQLVVERKVPEDLNRNIYISRMDHLMVYMDELSIEKDGENILCWVPVELVFNYDRDDTYGQIPMAAYYPLINMYRYLIGNLNDMNWEIVKKDFWLYGIEWANKVNSDFTEELKQSMLHSRIGVFNEMQKKSEMDYNFFIRNAVSANSGDNLQFYLSTSGRNRVAFLIAKGYRFIPINMNQRDYQRWLNEIQFKKLKNYLEKNRIEKFFTTIPHPLLQSYEVYALDYPRIFCMQVLLEIYRLMHWHSTIKNNDNPLISKRKYEELREEIKIFTNIEDEGTVSRLVAMGQINCYRLISDGKQRKISELIDKLMFIENSPYLHCVEDFSALKRCEILITDSRSKSEYFEGKALFILVWGDDKIDKLYDRYRIEKVLFKTIWNDEKACGMMLVRK